MRSLDLLLTTVSLSSSYVAVAAFSGGHRDVYHDHFGRDLHRRSAIVTDGKIADSYDFVIVGGGAAGLVLASRLSEDADTTVLVLEAGKTGDEVRDRINTPALTYYDGVLNTEYDWAYQSVAQPNAGGRQITWPRGKILGGSTAVNGMYHVRPSKVEVDAWAGLIDGGKDKWSWDTLFADMKKTEAFGAPSAAIQSEAGIQFNPASHGTSGPIHASYPGFTFPVVGDWTKTLAAVGVDVSPDPHGGQSWGAYIATSSINPANWTRSYARSGYIDPLPPRTNLAILPEAMVTKIIFDTSNKANLTATGVEYATSADAPRQTVKVNKEVLVTGGAIGSPHVLMHSGVGPKDVLDAAQVPVLLDLPGVGEHVQDHIATGVRFKTSIDTARSLHDAGESSPEFLSFINSAVAYVDLTDLLGDSAGDFRNQVNGALDSSASNLASKNAEVAAGYKAIYKATADLLDSPIGQVEILFGLTESGGGDGNRIAIQAAIQHPFSQGRIFISNNDPFTKPTIDPGYLTHSADIVLQREGMKLARKIGNTAPLNAVMQGEVSPGDSVQSDEDWDKWISENFQTEYHPSCSCAMLPKEQGGVVDANLKVYGLGNVRVADSSVYPIEFSAHLQAPTYALAEQAARLIRAQYHPDAPTSPNNDNPNNNNDNNDDQKPGAALALDVRGGALAAAMAVVAAAFALL